MLEQQAKVSNTQLELSTGRRINTAADDPAGAVRILGYNQKIDTVTQYQTNADRARSRLEQEESLLIGAGNLLIRAKELAIQGNNATLSSEDTRSIATEVRQLLDQLYGIANTRDANGEYVFAGYQSNTQPFARPAVDTFVYMGDTGNRQLQISSDRQIADGDNGYQVFMDVQATSGKRNMFETLQNLATELESNNPVDAYLTDLDLALENILETRTSIGGRMNAIDRQNEVNADLKLTLEAHRSQEGDLDYAEAITRFNRQMVSLQAAQQAYVKVQGLSLFNYI